MALFWILFAVVGFALLLYLGIILSGYGETWPVVLLIISAVIVLFFGSYMAFETANTDLAPTIEETTTSTYNYCPNCGFELPKGE